MEKKLDQPVDMVNITWCILIEVIQCLNLILVPTNATRHRMIQWISAIKNWAKWKKLDSYPTTLLLRSFSLKLWGHQGFLGVSSMILLVVVGSCHKNLKKILPQVQGVDVFLWRVEQLNQKNERLWQTIRLLCVITSWWWKKPCTIWDVYTPEV